jgi:phosphoglycerate dehydrogenase-like enzyme
VSASTRPRLLLQISRGRFEQLFTSAARERLAAVAEVAGPVGPRPPPEALAAAEALFLPTSAVVDRRVLAGAPRLRWIASANSAPPRLDYDAIAERDIVVTDSRRGFHIPVAEMALAHYLALTRGLMLHDRALCTRDCTGGVPPAENREASARRLGLLGFGEIGQTLARMLAPLQPEILVHDPYLAPGAAAERRAQSGMAGVSSLRAALSLCQGRARQPGPRLRIHRLRNLAFHRHARKSSHRQQLLSRRCRHVACPANCAPTRGGG